MKISTQAPQPNQTGRSTTQELEARRAATRQAQAWPIAAVMTPQGPTPLYLRTWADALVGAGRRGPAPAEAGATEPASELAAGVPGAGSIALGEPAGKAVVAFVDAGSLPGSLPAGGAIAGGNGVIVAHVIGARIVDVHGAPSRRVLDNRSGADRQPHADASVVVQMDPQDPLGTRADVTVRHPELGRIEIAVSVSGRAVSLAFRATASAARVLEDARPMLRDSLAEQGFSLVEWRVSTGRQVRSSHAVTPNHRHLDLEV